MAIPLLAGAAAYSLLKEDKTPNIIYNTSVPLTKEQADLYMQRPVYKDYLEQKIKTIYFYRDKNNNLQPMFYKDMTTLRIRRFLVTDIAKRRKNTETAMKKEDNTILLTEGIGGLKEAEGVWEEESDAMKTCGKIVMSGFAILIPCCLPCFCYQIWCKKEKGALKDVPDITLKGKDKNTGEFKIHSGKACLPQPISLY